MSSPKLPRSETYWKNKGKCFFNNTYKNVMIYTHDDLDGIYSAIAIKLILKRLKYNIIGYSVLNYQNSWDIFEIDTEIINICVDFSVYNDKIDIFIDHHQGELNNKVYGVKQQYNSAFETIQRQYNQLLDSLVLDPIDMIDSASYHKYGLSYKDCIVSNFNFLKFSKKPKLAFVSIINQLIKRSDYITIMEVIHNTTDLSFYQIYHKIKEFYPANNLSKGQRRDFINDGIWRLENSLLKTRGTLGIPKYYNDFETFNKTFNIDGYLHIIDGYKIIGNIMYIPSNTWCNSIKAMAIVEKYNLNVKYIMLLYNNTIQLVTVNNKYNIGKYVINLLHNFKSKLKYNHTDTNAGGHEGIGTISDIQGVYNDNYYLDLFRNKIIKDLTNIEWNIYAKWHNDIVNKHIPDTNSNMRFVEELRTNGKDTTEKELLEIKENTYLF